MDPAAIKALLQAQLADCEFHVRGDGSHYEIDAIGTVFEGLRAVKKQQLVYAALGECIADGRVHAVNIRTFTPDEWRRRTAS